MSPSERINVLTAASTLVANLNQAALAVGASKNLFPRKHRLNPDDAEHPAEFAAEGTYKLLRLAQEAIFAALELNQRAIPFHEGRVCPPLFAGPLRQAAEEASARATQRRLDSERDFLERHPYLGAGSPETPPRREGEEPNQAAAPMGNAPSDDCSPPSAKFQQ